MRQYPPHVSPHTPSSALDEIHLDQFVEFGVEALVTTRSGGVSTGPYGSLNLAGHVGDEPSHVSQNRSRLAHSLGVGDDALVFATQVHSGDVAIVQRGDVPGEVDALVTTDPSIALCILVADCVPALIIDPAAGVLAMVHAGWRGIAAQTMIAALDAASSLGAEPMRCRAYVGPCISPRGYEVGGEVAEAFRTVGCGDDVVADDCGRLHADLASASVRQLVGHGLRPEHVTVSSYVTDGGTRFFSDRTQRPCGRFAIAAMLVGRS